MTTWGTWVLVSCNFRLLQRVKYVHFCTKTTINITFYCFLGNLFLTLSKCSNKHPNIMLETKNILHISHKLEVAPPPGSTPSTLNILPTKKPIKYPPSNIKGRYFLLPIIATTIINNPTIASTDGQDFIPCQSRLKNTNLHKT